MTGSLTAQELEIFHHSLERALACDSFLDRFYSAFINRSDEISAFFTNSDMAHLKRKLSTTLRLITMAADDSPGADMYLEYLGKFHRDINVSEDLYSEWLDALIDTVKQCDPEYSAELEQLWRDIMGIGIHYMHQAYADHQ